MCLSVPRPQPLPFVRKSWNLWVRPCWTTRLLQVIRLQSQAWLHSKSIGGSGGENKAMVMVVGWRYNSYEWASNNHRHNWTRARAFHPPRTSIADWCYRTSTFQSYNCLGSDKTATMLWYDQRVYCWWSNSRLHRGNRLACLPSRIRWRTVSDSFLCLLRCHCARRGSRMIR